MVLGRLNALVKEFVQIVADKQGVGAATKREAGGKIFTFGSYRLGVHGPGSDIDTLIVVPGFVQRNDFFTIFEDMLQKEADVSEAHVRRCPFFQKADCAQSTFSCICSLAEFVL